MKTLPIPSLTLGVCLLALSAGVAFAANLKDLGPNTGTVFTPNGTGQTGSNVLSNCNPNMMGGVVVGTSFGAGAKSNNGMGSPFNSSVSKTYAGNPNNPTNSTGGGLLQGNIGHTSNANPNTAVSQYDNACGQAAARQLP
jgi:hypothetical protein